MNVIKKYFKKHYLGGAFLVIAAMVANLLNFAFNAYLGNALDLKEFGLISLVGSFYALASIGFNSLSSVINYRGGFLIGRYGKAAGDEFLRYMQKISLRVTVLATVAWIALTPVLASYFHTTNYWLFLLFAPVWLLGFVAFINKGYISSKLQFGLLGTIIIVEAVVKLLSAFAFIKLGVPTLAYASIPLSVAGVFIISYLLLQRKKEEKLTVDKSKIRKFPMKYFITSTIAGLSTLSFVSLDVVLARHYLTAEQAGLYALVSLLGKMVYFMAGLSSQFVVPIISHYEGAKKESKNLFYKILGATVLLTLCAFIPLGILSHVFAPILFGAKVFPILKFLPTFLLAMMAFSISRIFVSYYQVKREYVFPVIAFLLSFVQIGLIALMHRGLADVVNAMVVVAFLNLLIMVALHFNKRIVKVIEFNFGDFLSLFSAHKVPAISAQKLNILIFNWRDTKHKWGGGAEAYIHELAKRWVSDGNYVTVFCGNDYENKSNEIVEGVTIIRRGGFYTMYVWAFIYYILKLRGKYDVIIDSENGIPFFTPLFSRKPIYLLIHHVHQEVFLAHLKFPFAQIARFIEGTFMPFVYKNRQIITVSNSSKKEILKLGFSNPSNIEIVNPGIELEKFKIGVKTKKPSLVYVGRLKPYKNVDIAIKAVKKVVATHPELVFHIAGEGESIANLKKLTIQQKLSKSVMFHGKVGHAKKAQLLSESWVALQPSMIEGWGITVIEANASGTPVIASNVNGLRDSIVDGKTGLLVKSRDVTELTQAINKTIESNIFREKITKNAYNWSKNFDWNKSSRLFYSYISVDRNFLGVRKIQSATAVNKV